MSETRYCPNCGGKIGVDCFDIIECGEIARAMEQERQNREYSNALTLAEARISVLEDALRKDSEWIHANDPPPTGLACWVVYSGAVQLIAYRREGIGFACEYGYEWRAAIDVDGDPIPDELVTHWMPMTAPPVRDAALSPNAVKGAK